VKIDNSVGSVGGLPSGEPKPRTDRQSPRVPAASDEKVELSAVAGRMQQIEAALANVPVADAGKIAEIKQAMSEGRFKVDAGKVADRLIESVRQMIATQARRA
jgi:negative regulator of flagellin synthesis FlgM